MRTVAKITTILVAVLVCLALYQTSADSGPITGPISLVGVVQEHYNTRSEKGFPTREAWYLSLASIRRKGKPFGYFILTCSYVSTKSSVRECVGTFSLPRGKIMVAGSFLYDALYAFAVTGGTDTYVGTGGSVLFRKFVDSSRPNNYWIDIALN